MNEIKTETTLYDLIIERTEFVHDSLDDMSDAQTSSLWRWIKPTYQAEYQSHRDDGRPIISVLFRDLYGRSPVDKAESVRHGRALRKLEAAGKIDLVKKTTHVRWAMLNESESSPEIHELDSVD